MRTSKRNERYSDDDEEKQVVITETIVFLCLNPLPLTGAGCPNPN